MKKSYECLPHKFVNTIKTHDASSGIGQHFRLDGTAALPPGKVRSEQEAGRAPEPISTLWRTPWPYTKSNKDSSVTERVASGYSIMHTLSPLQINLGAQVNLTQQWTNFELNKTEHTNDFQNRQQWWF
jgi:hypothetical protein